MTEQFVPDGEAVGDGVEALLDPEPDEQEQLEALVAERTADLQRLQAEYQNYKKRVDRDRDLARAKGVESVVLDLLPVLDAIDAARSHDELDGGAALIADQLQVLAAKHGLAGYGEVGDPFDPMLHDALLHLQVPGYDVQTCSQVIQRGYRLGERVVRPARVAVTDADPDREPAPEPEAAPEAEPTPEAVAEPSGDDDQT